MRWIHLIGTSLIVAVAQFAFAANDSEPVNSKQSTRGSLSPSAPVNLTYQVEDGIAGQPQHIDVTISTRLTSGALLIDVARQDGAEIVGAIARRIDLATVARPITLHMQAIQLGAGEHFLVLLVTVETEIGPMSRSFRIDLNAAATSASQSDTTAAP